jgi:hypothetical protein
MADAPAGMVTRSLFAARLTPPRVSTSSDCHWRTVSAPSGMDWSDVRLARDMGLRVPT